MEPLDEINAKLTVIDRHLGTIIDLLKYQARIIDEHVFEENEKTLSNT